ncbi:MAG: LptE family protein [bacterium]
MEKIRSQKPGARSQESGVRSKKLLAAQWSILALFNLVTIGALSGCGYRILNQYPAWPEGIRRVHIETISNQTTEPGLDKTITNALIQEFWHWDRVRIVNRPEAQAILSGVITGYGADEPLSFDRDRNVGEYRLTIHLDLHLEEVATRKIFWQAKDITIQGDYQFFQNDLATTRAQENRAQQKAARDMARKLLDERFRGGS